LAHVHALLAHVELVLGCGDAEERANTAGELFAQFKNETGVDSNNVTALYRIRTLIATELGEYDRAVEHLHIGYETCRRVGRSDERTYFRLIEGKILTARNSGSDLVKAIPCFEDAEEGFTRLGIRPALGEVKMLLGRVLRDTGRHSEASHKLQEAREIFKYCRMDDLSQEDR